MKPNKGNKIIYKGYLTRLIKPIVIHKANQSYAIYRAVLSLKADDENFSAVQVYIPRNFDMSAVERMVGQRVTAVLWFKMNSRIYKGKEYYNNFIDVIKLEPVAETMKHLTQSLHQSPIEGGTDIDQDGYATPYDY